MARASFASHVTYVFLAGSAALSLTARAEDASGTPGDLLRSCAASSDGSVAVTRLWTDGDGAPTSVAREIWSPGVRMGRTSTAHPNVGYTSADGAIVNGAPTTRQPASLGCSADLGLVVGWQFSNNVAGTTVDSDVVVHTARQHPTTGALTQTRVSGQRRATYADPAAASGAYFDAQAGRVTLTRIVAYGTATTPNRVHVEQIDEAGGEAIHVQDYALTTAADAPLVETSMRTLDDDGWQLASRRLNSGTFELAFGDGTVTTVAVDHVVFDHDPEGRTTCSPRGGAIDVTITPARPDSARPVVHVARAFADDGAASTTIRCAMANPTKCAAKAAAALAAYGPTNCLY